MYTNGFIDFGANDTVVTLHIEHAQSTAEEIVIAVQKMLEAVSGDVNVITDSIGIASVMRNALEHRTSSRIHVRSPR